MKKIFLLLLVLSLFACKKEESSNNISFIKMNHKIGDRNLYVASVTTFLDDTTSLNHDETFSYTDTFEVYFPKDTIINGKNCLVRQDKSNNGSTSTSYIELTDTSINIVAYYAAFKNEIIIYPFPIVEYINPLKIGSKWSSISEIDTNQFIVVSIETVNISNKHFNCAKVNFLNSYNPSNYTLFNVYIDESGLVKRQTERVMRFRQANNAGIAYETRSIYRIN